MSRAFSDSMHSYVPAGKRTFICAVEDSFSILMEYFWLAAGSSITVQLFRKRDSHSYFIACPLKVIVGSSVTRRGLTDELELSFSESFSGDFTLPTFCVLWQEIQKKARVHAIKREVKIRNFFMIPPCLQKTLFRKSKDSIAH